MIGQCPFVVREHLQKLLWQILPIGEYPQKLLWQILLVGVQTEMCVSLTENRREAEYGTVRRDEKEGLPGCKGAVSGGDPGR